MLGRLLWMGAVVAALVAIVSAVSAAGAAPRPAAGPPAKVKRSHTITLVTGDRVFLNVLTDGRQTVTVDNPAGKSGRASPFRSFHSFVKDGDLYAYPVEVGPYVGRLLDPELFNLTELVAQGYSDKASASIPVIATYRSGAAPRSLPGGIARTRSLQSIGAVAGRGAKTRAASFGRALKRQLKADAPTLWKHKGGRLARTGPFARIKTIYLDRKVKASLADSVPQIGAPQAWAAGFDGTGVDVAVLDTGIDGTHPDLAGKVTAEANFTPEPSPADGHGHGTHVASTVAGSGAASGGLRKGVAPGARLMNGKVLNNFGSGLESWIIDGMEWAAANGAEVISMSLAGGPTDGTDPMAQAVDRITDTNGVLFTIAAGNIGFFGEASVTTPGTASKALTVGAVDKSNVLAFFSGPRPSARQLRGQAGHHGAGRRHHRGARGGDLARHADRRLLHDALRHLDGDAALGGRRRDPQAGVPARDTARAEVGARQHGATGPVQRLPARRRACRRGARLLAEGVRDPGPGRLRLLPVAAQHAGAGHEDDHLLEPLGGGRYAQPRRRGHGQGRHVVCAGASDDERLVRLGSGRRDGHRRRHRRRGPRHAEPLRWLHHG